MYPAWKKRRPEPCCEVRPSEGDIGHLQAGDGGDMFVPVCLVVILVVILDSFVFLFFVAITLYHGTLW